MPEPTIQRIRVATWFAIITLVLYISSWFVAGSLFPGYDPLEQAISETFAIGAPVFGRTFVSFGLAASGLGLIAFGWAGHHGLPGSSPVGPLLAALSGVMTVAVVAFPCTSGCPGFGTTFTDTWHVLTAGTGYTALILAPLLFGYRLRDHLPGFARVSFVLGGLALVGFLFRNLAGVDALGGLQQRTFNTIADLWYLAAGVVILRRAGEGPGATVTADAGADRAGLDR